jgi:hypothetical protein
MSISAISAASLSQSNLLSSDPAPLKQAIQSLQNSLASGDLNAAQSAFQELQKVNQALTSGEGHNSLNSSQFTSDLATLGGALSSGDLSTAQSAHTTVQADLKNTSSPALTDETNPASKSVQLVRELLSTVNVNSSSSGNSDLATSVLEQVYGANHNLNVQA